MLDVNKEQEGEIQWVDIPRTIWYFLEADRRNFVLSFFFLLIVYFYELVPVFVIGLIVDFFTGHSSGESIKTFYLYVAFISISYIIASLIRLKSKNVMSVIGIKSRTRAKIWAFERLTEFSMGWHNKENTGSKLQKVFTGTDAIAKWLGMLQRDLLKIFASIVGVTAFFIFVEPKFILLISFYVIVFLWIELSFSKRIFQISNEFNKSNQVASGVYVEGANNILTVKSLGGETSIAGYVASNETITRDLSIRRTMTSNIKWRWLQVVNGVMLGIFLLLTGYSFISHTITIGMILVFFTYFNKLQSSLSDISGLYTDMVNARSDLGQLMPIFNQTEFIKTGNEHFPKNWEQITFLHGCMEYPLGQSGLKELNLTIRQNDKIGIAGPSGSGKSTLVKTILGLYQLRSGEFMIGEKDYYSILHNEVLDNITVVLQETELFNMSLRENITMMRDLDEDMLNLAIEISQLNDVIAKLPNGLDTQIGEKGNVLSGGEKQRVGLARAIYKNSSIIILDEATSALDPEAEIKVMEGMLGDYGHDKTFLIIAHRLSTLKYADRIFILKNGSMIENGSYHELIKNKNSFFYKMNAEQGVV